MKRELPTVFVIDPDTATRSTISALVSGMNYCCRTFASGREFFAAYADSGLGCLVLEVKIPDMSGLQIQRRLSRISATLPQVFLTTHDDVAMAVELMRGGAVNYLQKPLRPLELLNAVQEAVALDHYRRKTQQRRQRLLERLATLTIKQREVLKMIAEGESTRSMATLLQVSPRTIELRRSGLMKKLGLRSTASLLHFALLAHRNGKHYLDGTRGPQPSPSGTSSLATTDTMPASKAALSRC